MNEMLLLAELLKKHRLETQEKDKRIAELEKTCKSRSDTIIEYSNKIAELQSILTLFKKDLLASCKEERDKYKAYFDSTL
jgi:uncharacterized coiled-coil protein SlyX